MRPRLITAENGPDDDDRHALLVGFNEAAAHHRGEQPKKARDVTRGSRFNEAAAHHRGERLHRAGRWKGNGSASMRPRLITAENRVHDRVYSDQAVKLQ